MESKFGSRRKTGSSKGVWLAALASFAAGGALVGYVVWYNADNQTVVETEAAIPLAATSPTGEATGEELPSLPDELGVAGPFCGIHNDALIVAGGANNQLENPGIEQQLHNRNILYAPDFVINAGGIINISFEKQGYDYDKAWEQCDLILAPTTPTASFPLGSLDKDPLTMYLNDVFGLSTTQIGTATLVMGSAMIAGTFVYGPLDRVFGTRKWVIFTGNALGVVALTLLCVWIDHATWLSVLLLAIIGFTGASFPVIMAHGRAFVPAHLVGRGVTLLNLFGIGGVGIAQFVTGRIHAATAQAGTTAPYTAIFGFFAVTLAIGCVIYLFSRDNVD